MARGEEKVCTIIIIGGIMMMCCLEGDTCVDFFVVLARPLCVLYRNYPTAENIAKKKKNDEEKRARGEVATTPLYR